jgi:UDP-glucose 4-epimerase
MRTILVTGGAGFVGSHTAVALLERGFDVVVVDDLSNSSRASVSAVERLTGRPVAFHQVDLTDRDATAEVFAAHPVDSVVHFAGFKAVGESVAEPLRYYRNNVGSTLNLVEAMAAHGVWDLVFSSSATVYGHPEVLPIPETAPAAPTNPYGRTKRHIEELLADLAGAGDRWRISLLRYFNPVGAHPSGDLGEDPRGRPNNLFPFALQVAVGRRPFLEVFGDDYDTPDGTGVRDYIHVVDLARGHLCALEHLRPGCRAYNLGTGTGASVLEVVRAIESVSGRRIPYQVVGRRPGDVATSVADPRRAHDELGWRADRGLEVMARDAWNWQSRHPYGFGEGDTGEPIATG